MEERRVKRFQIGDSISPTSFVPVKRKSRTNTSKQASILSRSNRMDADRRKNRFNNNKTSVNMANGITVNGNGTSPATSTSTSISSNQNGQSTTTTGSTADSSSDSIEPPKQPSNPITQTDYNNDYGNTVETSELCEQSDSDTRNSTNSTVLNDRSHANDANGAFCDFINVNLRQESATHGIPGALMSAGSSLGSAVVPDSRDAMAMAMATTTTPTSTTTTIDNNVDDNYDEQTTINPMTKSIDNKSTADSDNIRIMSNAHHTDAIDTVNRADSSAQSSSHCINGSATSHSAHNAISTDLEHIASHESATNHSDSLYRTSNSENCATAPSETDDSDFDVQTVNGKCETHENQHQQPENSNDGGDRGNHIQCSQNEATHTECISGPKASMDTDRSLRMPLLAKQANGQHAPNDYNAIERAPAGNDNEATTEVDVNGKTVAYNDYVNLLCDTADSKRKVIGGRKVSGGDETRPLLQQSMSYDGCSTSAAAQAKFRRKSSQKPARSIVKSPSFSTSTGEGSRMHDANRKPRLSIQCTGSDPERPVLHVQFLSQQPQSDDLSPDHPQSMKSNLLSLKQGSSSSGEHQSLQSTASPDDIFADKPPEELIHQMPPRSILRTSRVRSSISSESSSSSSDSSSVDVSQFAEAKPPDGGYGWVIVFAAFMVNLIADGITFSFGVIYVELLKYFGEGKAKTAWIGSLFMAMPLLSGPIASYLTDRYGCRKVTIVGSILAAIGFIISAFTDSVEMLFLTFGVFAGFGLSMCYVAAVVVVAYYFDKRRSFATGLSVCGSGIGTFLFAPITQMLIDEYGWRGTTLILAGMFLNMTVCGALMRDLEWTTYKSKQKAKERRKRNKLGISADSFSVSNSTNTGTTSNLQKDDANGNEFERAGDHRAHDDSFINRSDSFDDSRLFSSLIMLPTFVNNGEKVPVEVLELMSSNKHVNSVLFKNYTGLAHSRSFSQPLTSSRHSNGPSTAFDSVSPTVDENGLVRTKSRRVRDEEAFLAWLKHDPGLQHSKNVQMMMQNRNPSAYLKNMRMHRRSLTYRGAMLNINRYRLRASSCPDIYRNSMTTIAKEKTQWGQSIDELKSVLIDMLDFSFFTDIRFTLFAFSNFLLYAWYDVPYVYLADNAVGLGFTESDASILISMIGIVNMVGEIILGWFGDQKSLSAGMIYAICMVFCGIACALVPLLTSYTGLSVLSGLFGLFIAANYALTSIILVELISLERFTNAYGLLLLVQGIANLIGPPLAGWITDLTGNYDLAFYLAGAFIVASGTLMMLLPVRGKIRKYRRYRRQGRSSGEESSSTDDEEADIEKCLSPIKEEEPKSPLRYNGTPHKNGDKFNEI